MKSSSHRSKRWMHLGSDPLPEQADVVVVGAGIMGLSVAWNLARMAPKPLRIAVIERSHLLGGASGRNGGGVRAQWSDETNIRLMKRSLAICESFATEMGFNVWFRRGGYLFLVRSEHVFRELSKAVELQRELGLRTRLIDVDEAKAIVPQLNTQGLLCASWNPDDAVVFPWPFVWGYAQAAKKLGVSLTTFTEVIDFELKGNRILGVLTSKGRIQSNHVILCTGAWTSGLARRIGVEVPSHPHRHEICSSEPLKPFLGPLVGDLENGLYFSQSMRGEIVGGIANPKVPPGLNQESSSHFLARYAHALLKVIPILGHVKIVRQWAGCYDITPDGHPICGEVEEVRGLYLLSGFMGHGFMMAPAMGESFAKYFLFGEERQLFERWNLRRFRDGKLLRETMILG